ncbi:MAG TPA: glycerol-3-phosphate dehydrogenase [Marinilabiliales bacterium]|jgi:glycerol-3-phosphate dehydrogenase (NAD(P)+)|nr:MAG: glycerol-3-phosphate dehydrogenase [Bacteroidetes bacterium GWA2_40_14]OFX59901.1 MAG: glycerol-3-phosphate dehydrogenase [Bacteroidetes bacterium GWC2_40_13]OFX75124.1 MAG: glycerol-3-phosphate dehydrogenase [Bacteroidetes bacterium GWD2_40_43]OFX93827.1 MAG: glycerol-3-phosphate dehydrogenase [Bacteroidetes bacterium GWE2_40_63]OFY18100.1 MAG: glycerol-3-phosphate dehydrogenase [Bacteroidetes bacterium GWF2_40_13]OFZ27289.1 MAG: glycerol-3-phosphate dehydrogenase [Bacteroidetes bacte
MFNLGKIGIVGGGSWATANAKIILEKKQPINWFIHEADVVEHIKEFGNNPKYLSDVEFDPELLNLTSDINQLVSESDTVMFIIPSAYLKFALQGLTVSLKGKTVVSAIKGIVPDDNLLVGEFLHDKYNVPYESLGIISGPCHAEEVALERLSYLTIAFIHEEKAKALTELYNNHYIRTNLSDDILGTEYAAVLKNIYALGSGICNGLGFGDNFQAVLISNAIREMKRFTDTVYPIHRDIKDSAYLGDLLVTAYSQFSRNRYFGTMVGKGYTIKYIMSEMNMVAEGYFASKGIWEINKKHRVTMPIADSIYQILYEKQSPRRIINELTEKLT